ncbi:MAG: hypothetical protein ACFFBI_00755 [Promethearchaeota archaeon]
MRLKNKNYPELNFESEDDTSNSLRIIRSEFLIKGIKGILLLSIIIIILIITSIFVEFPSQNYIPVFVTLSWRSPSGKIDQPNPLISVFSWFLFSIGIFLVFYFIKSIQNRSTPSILKLLKNELKNLGFETQKESSSYKIFLILNFGGLIILLLIVFDISNFKSIFIRDLFMVFIAVYLTISLIIPIIWRFFFDRYIVKLKKHYYILLHPNYKIRKIKKKDNLPLGIYITSNRIAFKLNKDNKNLYNKISENRWLPRKRKSPLLTYYLNPCLHFHEFSTPINFQKQFLNVVLALQEWDSQLKNAI